VKYGRENVKIVLLSDMIGFKIKDLDIRKGLDQFKFDTPTGVEFFGVLKKLWKLKNYGLNFY